MIFFDETQARHSGDFADAIFVFGSNLAGRHGAGAALYAHDIYEAEYGVGVGRTGQAYAIPTKTAELETLALEYIHHQVKEFLEYARFKKDEVFFVTRIGCGLAGYQDKDIAPFFRGAPANCIFDIKWKDFLVNTSL
jgi:hypothetical protein